MTADPSIHDRASLEAWLERFHDEHGRAPRVLHVGNIANNAYNNAKVLNRAGFDCDVICYDYYHIMGCPEWEDADFAGSVDDHFAPEWGRVDLRGFSRPRWFAQGTRGACTRYLVARRRGRRLATAVWWRVLELQQWTHAHPNHLMSRLSWLLRPRNVFRRAWLEAQGVHGAVLRRLDRWPFPYGMLAAHLWWTPIMIGLVVFAIPAQIVRALARGLRGVFGASPSTYDFNRRVAELLEDFDRCFPDRADRLHADDASPYRHTMTAWRRLFKAYDLIEAYSTDPIVTMLAEVDGYVAYEHGTIREIPFDRTGLGRLTALGYRNAATTIITNPDCRAAAEKLGLSRYRAVPHLIDRKYYDDSIRAGGNLPPGVRAPYVFCPARHDWDVKGTDILLRAFGALAAEHPDLQLVTPSWGGDLDRSRALIAELGLEERVTFIEPMHIHDLIRVAHRADVLVDQFRYGVFGGIGPTALAVGTPLVTHLDPAKSNWCMDEPPYFEAKDVTSCGEAIVAAMQVDRHEHARLQRAWMEANYWHEDVVFRHAEIYRALIDAPKRFVSQEDVDAPAVEVLRSSPARVVRERAEVPDLGPALPAQP